ncbi:MAG: hypothetical protein JWQ96_726 [Segetibacter sp.]|nr:hypothetical protein [Segetibacter sp.]
MRKYLFILGFVCMAPFALPAQRLPVEMTYKSIDTTKLRLKLYYPDNYVKDKGLPAIILFFGGSWSTGSINQLEPQAKHFASKGMIAVTADYRVKTRNNTSPFEAVKDAKSAIRFLRKNAIQLGIDSMRLAAGGASAGGHIAAAADLTSLDDKNENLAISSRPNALVLFNPVFNNGPGEFGYDKVGDGYRNISPFHNIRKGAAPTIAFFGTEDKFVHPQTAQLYKKTMEESGNRCDLFFYEGQQHGFFNYGKDSANTYFNKTIEESDKFLRAMGYIK